MKTKKIIFHIASAMVLALTAVVYILAGVASDFKINYIFFEDNALRLLLPLLVAEYEIIAGIGYFAFEKNGNIRKANTGKNGIICGILLLVGVWYTLWPNILRLPRWFVPFYRLGYPLCELLRGVIMLFLAIRRLVNTKREREEASEEAISSRRRIASNVVNVTALVVSVAVSIYCLFLCLGTSAINLLMFGLGSP